MGKYKGFNALQMPSWKKKGYRSDTISGAGSPQVSIYFFDGHTSITDSSGMWSNDANAFNGTLDSTGTDVASYSSLASGSVTANTLTGVGTTATNLGGTISQVRYRIGARFSAVALVLHGATFIGAEQVGTTSVTNGTVAPLPMGSWVTLSVPSGGWTWAKIIAAEIRFWAVTEFEIDSYVGHASIAQLEVTYTI